ncbi:MAG: PIN domain-containing protein [Candidatus Sulfotelmatobacter sp.]
MDVLLDANVLYPGVDTAVFKALREYLRRTRSSLLVPLVVLEEICAHRERQILKLIKDMEDVKKEARRLFPKLTVELPSLDLGQALSKYRADILKSAENVLVLENTPEHFKELVTRLTRRIAPASPDGEEARDVLLWLNLLDVAPKRKVAFVSSDRRAFFQDEKFRPELLNELAKVGNNVEAFYGLDSFLRSHNARLSFIDKEWLEDKIPETEAVTQAIQQYIDARGDLFTRQIEDKGEPTGWLSLVGIISQEVEDYFVSDLEKKALYVGVTLWTELEIEMEYIATAEPGELTGERGYQFLYLYPCLRFHIQCEVADEMIISAVISRMDLG